MCNALMELMKDELKDEFEKQETAVTEKGVAALIKTCQEFHVSREETIQRIRINFSLTDAKIDSYMKKYWMTA